MLSPQVPTLVGYLGNQSLTEALLGALVDVSQASPSSLVSFLSPLRILGQQCPAFLAHVAKIHGAVGIISEVKKTKKKNTHTQKRALPHFKFWWSHLQVQLLVHLWAAPVAAIFRLLPGDDLLTTGGQSRWFVHDLQLSGSSGVCSLFFISSSTLKMWQLFGHSSITH